MSRFGNGGAGQAMGSARYGQTRAQQYSSRLAERVSAALGQAPATHAAAAVPGARPVPSRGGHGYQYQPPPALKREIDTSGKISYAGTRRALRKVQLAEWHEARWMFRHGGYGPAQPVRHCRGAGQPVTLSATLAEFEKNSGYRPTPADLDEGARDALWQE